MREQVIDDLERIEATLKKIEAILWNLRYRDITDAEQAGAALYLSNLYTGIESIALRLCKARGVPVPERASWHLDLLDLFSTGANVGLPLLFDDPLLADLDAYRRFRHFVRHGYGVDIDWPQVVPLLQNARSVLTNFTSRVRSALDASPSSGAPLESKE